MIAAREKAGEGSRRSLSVPEPLRSQLIEALAQLLVADLEQFPDLPIDQQVEPRARTPR